MIRKTNGSSRRIFMFPAVHPCESISPSTLLNSLIDIGRSISGYKSKFFVTNKVNARETFRHVSNLLVFLEEVRDGASILPDAVVLSLSELHLTFQRLRYLLEDCTTDGARVWMLVRSDQVANLFRILIRAIATDLDVFPLGLVHVSSEAKDMVDLIIRQVRKAKFESDPDDIRVSMDLMWVLNRLENGIVPDPNTIKQVLDHLRIRKCSDCNNEVKFLDSEIGIECFEAEKKKELELLSSLMAFMSYCRGVVFDSVDSEDRNQINTSSEILKGINVDDLRCPISLELMSDPVTLSTGHTYDRGSIMKWFRSGNATCPKTGERLTTTEFVPNLAIRGIIQQYRVENGCVLAESSRKSRDISRTVLAGSVVAENALKILAGFLVNKLAYGSLQEMNKAAIEIRVLTRTSIFNRSCLVDAGTVPYLLNLLLSEVQENAIAALLNLSKHSKSKDIIVENGGLDLIVHVLRKGIKIESRQNAAATLFYIASIQEFRILIGEHPGALRGLLELVRNGNDRAKKNALIAIFGLLSHSGNHWRVLAAGAVPLLLNLLKDSDREDHITDSLAILSTLAENLDGAVAILRHGALQQILGLLETSTSREAKEHCVSLLLALCINGGPDTVGRLLKSPSLTGPLYSQLSDGTSRARKKAGALIRVLHEFCERRSSTSATSVPPQERFVHVW
ncbi:hypothetical protein SLE2022_045730 [Rubroshorea leprosula]